MRSLASTMAAVLVVSALLAGCSGGPSDGSEAGGGPLGGPKDLQDGLGGVAGRVMDEDDLPLAEATVGIQGLGVSATTDLDGWFELMGLEPGSVLLVAQKLGYHTHAQRVDVVAGSVAEISVRLAPFVIVDPFIDVKDWTGYIECAVGTTAVLANCLPIQFLIQMLGIQNPTQTRTIGLFPVEEPRDDIVGALYEMEWTRTTGVTAERLALLVERELTGPTAGRQWASGTGTSPVRVAIESAEPFTSLDPEDPDNDQIQVRVFPAGTSPPTAVVDQRFTVWQSVFYFAHPGPAYSVFEDE